MTVEEKRRQFRQEVLEYKQRLNLDNLNTEFGIDNFNIRGIASIDDIRVVFIGNNSNDELSHIIVNFISKELEYQIL